MEMGTAARKVLMGRRMRDETAAGKETGLHHAAAETLEPGSVQEGGEGMEIFFSQGYPQELIQISKVKIFAFSPPIPTTKADDHRLNKRRRCWYPPAHPRHFPGLTGQPDPMQDRGPAPAPRLPPAARITPSLLDNFLLHPSPTVPRTEMAKKCSIRPKGHSLLPDHSGGWEQRRSPSAAVPCDQGWAFPVRKEVLPLT